MDDASPPSGTNTSIRTLEPATLSAETVTVTVTPHHRFQKLE